MARIAAITRQAVHRMAAAGTVLSSPAAALAARHRARRSASPSTRQARRCDQPSPTACATSSGSAPLTSASTLAGTAPTNPSDRFPAHHQLARLLLDRHLQALDLRAGRRRLGLLHVAALPRPRLRQRRLRPLPVHRPTNGNRCPRLRHVVESRR